MCETHAPCMQVILLRCVNTNNKLATEMPETVLIFAYRRRMHTNLHEQRTIRWKCRFLCGDWSVSIFELKNKKQTDVDKLVICF